MGTPNWTKVTTSPLGAGDLVSAIAVSPSNPNVVYVGYQDGTVQVSVDAGTTWTTLPTEPFTDTFITGISVNPRNQQAITVSVSYTNTRTQPASPHVALFSYTSSVGSGSWSVASGDLPPNAAVSHVIYGQGALCGDRPRCLRDHAVGLHGVAARRDGPSDRAGPGRLRRPLDQFLYAVTHGRGAWKVAPPSSGTAPAFTADTPPTAGTVGTAYSYTYVATGNPAPTFAVATGTLPAGLSLNATTGVLSGTPTTAGSVHVHGLGHQRGRVTRGEPEHHDHHRGEWRHRSDGGQVGDQEGFEQRHRVAEHDGGW